VRIPRLVTGLVVVAAALLTTTTALPALADPPGGVAPGATTIVGVGSNTDEDLFDQFARDYDGSHRGAAQLYSWDAENPSTGALNGLISFKKGCVAEPRPNGSGAGVTALTTNQGGSVSGHPCVDFARSSSGRSATVPPYAPGGVAYIALAGDAVTYATVSGSNAPNNLSTAQLTEIFECQVTNWGQVGGKNAPIQAYLPQTSSGTRSFFLKAIGVSSPGACVSDENNNLEENEGTNPLLHSKDAIFPYSVGKYIAQAYHAASCLNSGCGPVHGAICHPGGGQDAFGCDNKGSLVLRDINGTAPTTGSGRNTVINPGFTTTFQRTLYDVVRYSASTGDHIPSYLEPLFGAGGWICTSSTAKADLVDYGFIVLPSCGHTD
jgi:ABC-type phosphate transport system substrate-binding protein